MNENEYENASSDDEQSQQTMAASNTNVVQTNFRTNSKSPDVQDPNNDEIDNSNTFKPIFLQDQDIFGSVKVTKPMWVTHVEIYKTMCVVVDPAAIKGIQRVRSMWRIYMDNEIDRLTLITSCVTMRGRHIVFYTQNTRNPARKRSDTTRIRVKGVPLSADDGQIRRVLEIVIKVRDGTVRLSEGPIVRRSDSPKVRKSEGLIVRNTNRKFNIKFMGNYLKFEVVSFVHDLTGNITAIFNLIHSL